MRDGGPLQVRRHRIWCRPRCIEASSARTPGDRRRSPGRRRSVRSRRSPRCLRGLSGIPGSPRLLGRRSQGSPLLDRLEHPGTGHLDLLGIPVGRLSSPARSPSASWEGSAGKIPGSSGSNTNPVLASPTILQPEPRKRYCWRFLTPTATHPRLKPVSRERSSLDSRPSPPSIRRWRQAPASRISVVLARSGERPVPPPRRSQARQAIRPRCRRTAGE